MESNWPVVHTAGKPWSGPGPFEQYVAAVEARSPKALRPHASPFVLIANGMSFHPAPPPNEVRVQSDRLLGLYMQAREEATGGGDDTPLYAAVGRVILAGPKLFRPTARECEPLEQVEVGLTAADINLPFPVCVVEFPPDYAADRIIPSPTDAVPVRPGFVVAVQENGVLTVNIVLPETQNDILCDFLYLPVNESTVEEVLGRVGGRGASFAPFVRAALNFLMLAAGGHRLVGPANPAQARTLRERIKRARKDRDKDKVEELRSRLRRLPSVFTLAQEVKLFDREQPPADPNPDADGTPKTPHWRKGHWRRVAVGAGRTGRKAVFIRPVLVNGHLLPR
ncbi:MAG: hypothetical protein U0804_22245 [Gemmataceae bacterium]